MGDTDQKYCNRCKIYKPISEFGMRPVGNKYYHRSACRVCENQKRLDRKTRSGTRNGKPQQRYKIKISQMRRDGLDLPRWILQDSRGADRKRGLVGDLDRAFIAQTIVHGCAYCGERNLRMTLDRIDNSKGHLKTNVVPCCIRCNYLRRDMPYAAWYCLIPSIKEAVQKGLFGNWVGGIKPTKESTGV